MLFGAMGGLTNGSAWRACGFLACGICKPGGAQFLPFGGQPQKIWL